MDWTADLQAYNKSSPAYHFYHRVFMCYSPMFIKNAEFYLWHEFHNQDDHRSELQHRVH